jgi:outer membrane immunogenic protein
MCEPWAMKKFLLTTTALTAFAAVGPAMSADLPVKAPPPPVAVFSWTGFYVGANAGGAWGHSDATTNVSCGPVPGFTPYFCGPAFGQAAANAVAASGTGSMSGSAFTGGGQIGYNWQNSRVVYGIEADIQSFNIKASRQGSANDFTNSTSLITSSVATDWLFTARGRVGLAFENLLAYATGGLAVTNLSATHTFIDNNTTPPGAGTWTGSATKLGWTVGGGLEWALSRNWSVKAEYLYLNFGSVGAAGTIINPLPPGYANAIGTSVDLTAHIARAGVNYKF